MIGGAEQTGEAERGEKTRRTEPGSGRQRGVRECVFYGVTCRSCKEFV